VEEARDGTRRTRDGSQVFESRDLEILVGDKCIEAYRKTFFGKLEELFRIESAGENALYSDKNFDIPINSVVGGFDRASAIEAMRLVKAGLESSESAEQKRWENEHRGDVAPILNAWVSGSMPIPGYGYIGESPALMYHRDSIKWLGRCEEMLANYTRYSPEIDAFFLRGTRKKQ
jgi:hypothetical protein